MIKKNTKGYSIVEIIVYLAIFTSLSILVINSFIVILSSFNRTDINRKLLESGTISMERISREIRQAQSVSSTSSQDTLILLKNNKPFIKFAKVSNAFNLCAYDANGVNCASTDNLLSQHVSLKNLAFNYITTPKGGAVKIKMTAEFKEGTYTKSENFYNTIVLRGSYK